MLAAVFPLLLLAPAASAETISGAMAKAYANNPDVNAARAGLRATDEGVTIAKAGYRPKISANASASETRLYDIGGVSGLDKSSRSSSYGLSITQNIFDGFQTLNSIRAAEANVYATRESMRATEMSILLAAAQSYANVARDQQIVSVRQQNLGFLNEQLKAANARLEVGEGTRTDVSQAQAQLAAAKALLAAAVAQLKSSKAVYMQIVGTEATGIRQPGPVSAGIPASVDAAVATGMRDHPSVLAAMHGVDAAGYNVKTAEGSMLPGVSVTGALGRNYNSLTSSSTYNSASITAQLNVPIYQGGAEYGQIRRAKELLSQSRIQVDSVRLSIQQQIVSAYAALEAARAAIEANRAQLSASNLALSGVIEERNVGQSTTLDVLNAQQSVLNAKESLASAERDAVVYSYSVLAAMGHLTVASQGLNVAEYKPEEHYEAVKDAWFGLRTVGDR
nr:TolC family outer membrane protein [Rhizobium sp. L1K21]